MEPGFGSPEFGTGGPVRPQLRLASMGPGLASPEFNSQNVPGDANNTLQWDRALRARNSPRRPSSRGACGSFNGTGPWELGIQCRVIPLVQQTELQCGRALGARNSQLRDPRRDAGHLASMWPGFGSPEFLVWVRDSTGTWVLQCGRALGARNSRRWIKSRSTTCCFNGAGLWEPGIQPHSQTACGRQLENGNASAGKIAPAPAVAGIGFGC